MRKVLIKVGRYIWEFNARATLSMRVVALLPTGTTTTTGRRRRTFTRRAAAKEETTDTHEDDDDDDDDAQNSLREAMERPL